MKSASEPVLEWSAPPAEAGDLRTLKRQDTTDSQKVLRSARKQTLEVTSCLRQLTGNNDSGVIDTKLLTKAMNAIGLPYTEPDLTHELLSADADGDGTLELHEFETNLAQQEFIATAGLEGALVPWDIGRCLAMDALPLAARAYVAHSVVANAIRDSEIRCLSSPKRKKDGSATSPKVAAPVAISSELAQLKRGLRTPLPPRADMRVPSPPRPAPAASPRPLSSYSLWEETKEDFADYLEQRKQYVDTFPSARRLRMPWGARRPSLGGRPAEIHRPRSRPLLQGSASVPTLGGPLDSYRRSRAIGEPNDFVGGPSAHAVAAGPPGVTAAALGGAVGAPIGGASIAFGRRGAALSTTLNTSRSQPQQQQQHVGPPSGTSSKLKRASSAVSSEVSSGVGSGVSSGALGKVRGGSSSATSVGLGAIRNNLVSGTPSKQATPMNPRLWPPRSFEPRLTSNHAAAAAAARERPDADQVLLPEPRELDTREEKAPPSLSRRASLSVLPLHEG
jgi:hypothetical protein